VKRKPLSLDRYWRERGKGRRKETNRQTEGERKKERGEKESDREMESRWGMGVEVERVH